LNSEEMLSASVSFMRFSFFTCATIADQTAPPSAHVRATGEGQGYLQLQVVDLPQHGGALFCLCTELRLEALRQREAPRVSYTRQWQDSARSCAAYLDLLRVDRVVVPSSRVMSALPVAPDIVVQQLIQGLLVLRRIHGCVLTAGTMGELCTRGPASSRSPVRASYWRSFPERWRPPEKWEMKLPRL
jgi:hypothetical protein